MNVSDVGPAYSALWFRTFLDNIAEEQTAQEIAFLRAQLPLPSYARVLDLCCGAGRHALPLAANGYVVTGIERDTDAIERARTRAGGNATFIQCDVRAVRELGGEWDAALIMWASFGFFNADENFELLRDIGSVLRPGGRLVLDVYHREWFAQHQGEHRRTHAGVDVVETKYLEHDRLSVELRYHGVDTVDTFDWQVFTPAELQEVLRTAGFNIVTVCARFDPSVAASAAHARMQLVAERNGG